MKVTKYIVGMMLAMMAIFLSAPVLACSDHGKSCHCSSKQCHSKHHKNCHCAKAKDVD